MNKKKFRYGTCPACERKGIYIVKKTYNPDYTHMKCKYCGNKYTIS